MIQIVTNESNDGGMCLKVMIGYGSESDDGNMCLKVMIGGCVDTRDDLNTTIPSAREARRRTNI